MTSEPQTLDAPTDADPLVLGKAEAEEVTQIATLRQKSESILYEIGRSELAISRLSSKLDELNGQKSQLVLQIEQVEVEGKGILDGIQERFGIAKDEPWQYLPDGTVRKIDVEAMKAAQVAAQAAAQAQEGAAE